MSVILFTSNQIAALLGGNGSGLSLQEGAAAYIKGLAYGMPAIFINTVLASAIQIDSGRKLVFTSVMKQFNAKCDADGVGGDRVKFSHGVMDPIMKQVDADLEKQIMEQFRKLLLI